MDPRREKPKHNDYGLCVIKIFCSFPLWRGRVPKAREGKKVPRIPSLTSSVSDMRIFYFSLITLEKNKNAAKEIEER